MATVPQADENDIPQFVRRCWLRYQDATKDLRDASVASLKMWLGGKHQWLPAEIASRTGANRPYLTVNRLKPVVDQVENEARSNPPGPQAHPVGGGADRDGADILEGLIREYEYRSDAHRAYVTSLRYAAAGNYGVFEMATEYAAEDSNEQQVVIKEGEDPSMYFVDTAARMACREDAMWGGKIRVLSRDQLIEAYPGKALKVLNRAFAQRAAGWMQSAVGWNGNQSTINLWTGGTSSDGPYYVCEFYRVRIKREKWSLYDDNIGRFESEAVPAGRTVKLDSDGEEISHMVPRRRVKKYVVTALDTLDETDWMGDIIPHFWVMGPEIYIDGKLYRLSLIDGASDSQRGLNYAATSAAETVNTMTKAPWIGWEGQFDTANAQGINPWESSNTRVWAYLEVKPVFATNPSTGETTLLPAPQRNTWEAPIARILELATFFTEQIKAATSVFFDPSIQSARDAQSGEAIKALQSQTNIGTLNWQDNLHRAVTLSYNQAAKIMPKLYDGPRVKTIVRADSAHEQVEINREFPEGQSSKEKRNNIMMGKYSLRVTAGPSFQTRTEKSIESLTEVFKIAPQILGAPGVAGKFLRLVGEGAPQVEQIADMIEGAGEGGEASPDQLQAQILQLRQSDQVKTMMLQKMQQALQAQLPKIEADKWKAMLDGIVKIEVAKISASKDADRADADRLAAHIDSVLGMAHDAATQATEHQQAGVMADKQQAGALEQQQQAAALQPEPQPQGEQG